MDSYFNFVSNIKTSYTNDENFYYKYRVPVFIILAIISIVLFITLKTPFAILPCLLIYLYFEYIAYIHYYDIYERDKRLTNEVEYCKNNPKNTALGLNPEQLNLYCANTANERAERDYNRQKESNSSNNSQNSLFNNILNKLIK